MAAEHPSWGGGRIADEMLLELGLRVSPRTAAKYVNQRTVPRGFKDQRWSTFMRTQAQVIVACDFFVSITATLRALYVFVAMEIGQRRLLHFHVAEHPTGEWTVQQLRETLPADHPYRFLIHDRHSSFSAELDKQVKPSASKSPELRCERQRRMLIANA
jgi:hypothetical protein